MTSGSEGGNVEAVAPHSKVVDAGDNEEGVDEQLLPLIPIPVGRQLPRTPPEKENILDPVCTSPKPILGR